MVYKLVVLYTYAASAFSFKQKLNRVSAEAACKNPVRSAWRSAALDVP